MRRYFFDVSTGAYVQYDYRGRVFPDADQARQLAELIALDVECIEGDDIVSTEVQVRDIAGKHLFSVPIGMPELAAA